MRIAFAIAVMLAGPALAETVVATRTIRPQEIIGASDVKLENVDVPGAHVKLENVIGLEAQYALYPGRAVMRGALAEPAVVERNQFVVLVYQTGGLRIVTDGRALDRGAVGDRIRVMNVNSRTSLFGTISEDGTILVSN
ncbi:flagellar basal body P-ring formation chaperone FlgA [Tropicibacter alexandrii]|uniref:flagellar basal body P-ring formation chaperone FlgA n=1 Tax=Tropicibacter alexandrii TaxID=2267683 RepID=UPI000EF53DDE|nr:flagellar basal body P-ring formation chaperone FlgA [Tropicibacter alexandrii]